MHNARRQLVVAGMVAALAGCGAPNPFSSADPRSIAGEYQLKAVDGRAVPCCTIDSAGARVTILGGLLTLSDAAPEEYVYTPAGIPMAKSCVHQIPDGATVDGRTGVVTLKDGTTYTIPPCGDGDYTLTLTRRYEDAGMRRVASETTSARYTWGQEPAGGGILSLLGGGKAGGLGTIATSAGGVALTVDMGIRVGPFPPLGPRYTFLRFTR